MNNSRNFQFIIAEWLAIVCIISYSLSFIYIPFLISGSPDTKNYLTIIYIIIALIFSYLFIPVDKLLKNKYKIDTLSSYIYSIIIFNLVIVISAQFMNMLFSNVSFSLHPNFLLHPEHGLLFLGIMALKVVFGFVLLLFANKLRKQKNYSYELEMFRFMVKISGILYIIAGFAYTIREEIFSVIANIIIAFILRDLFSKAARETKKSIKEA